MANPVSQGMRTFGERPKPFQFEEGGELYYVGSEVGLPAPYCRIIDFVISGNWLIHGVWSVSSTTVIFSVKIDFTPRS